MPSRFDKLCRLKSPNFTSTDRTGSLHSDRQARLRPRSLGIFVWYPQMAIIGNIGAKSFYY